MHVWMRGAIRIGLCTWKLCIMKKMKIWAHNWAQPPPLVEHRLRHFEDRLQRRALAYGYRELAKRRKGG